MLSATKQNSSSQSGTFERHESCLLTDLNCPEVKTPLILAATSPSPGAHVRILASKGSSATRCAVAEKAKAGICCSNQIYWAFEATAGREPHLVKISYCLNNLICHKNIVFLGRDRVGKSAFAGQFNLYLCTSNEFEVGLHAVHVYGPGAPRVPGVAGIRGLQV